MLVVDPVLGNTKIVVSVVIARDLFVVGPLLGDAKIVFVDSAPDIFVAGPLL